MFTGIVQELGRVREIAPTTPKPGASPELRLRVDSSFRDIRLGESIAINGVCLTVTEFSPPSIGATGAIWLDFHASQETLARTNLGSLREGAAVNLERALLATDRLSGHIVQGHVDGIAKFIHARERGESHETLFQLPDELASYCVEKGSIALNGVSLTINQARENEISIMLIPHTWRNTNLSFLVPGEPVNVEIDIFAKYARQFADRFRTEKTS